MKKVTKKVTKKAVKQVDRKAIHTKVSVKAYNKVAALAKKAGVHKTVIIEQALAQFRG